MFSNHYLNDHLRETEPWNEVSDADIEAAYQEINSLWIGKQRRVDDYNEAQLEKNFIRPIFDILDIPFEIEETVMRNARRPDYGFFPSEEAADAAFDRENFYEEAIAVADAKRWGRKLDTRGKEKRDFENPSYQIHRYLQETPTQWAVLTNGEKWRLYYGPTSHRLDSYYEIDLPELLNVVDDDGDLEAFKEFYLFFRQEAYLLDQSGDCFLDDVYDESSMFAEELGEELQENIYEAIRVLAEGFLDTNDDLNEDDLELVHDSSLIYLYRLIFVLYAESEGRNLLPTDNDIYSGSYSLNELKQTVVENRNKTQQQYQVWQTNLWDRLDELFILIDQGSQGQGIPKEDLYIPAYNGGLFRTNPDEDDTVESQFLASHEAGDAYIAEVIELLTRHEASEGEGKVFVDYSSLDERNLGSIYEGLLEYKLDVADEPLTVDDGEYVVAEEGDDIIVEEGEVYLRTDGGDRKATGSYYTPEYVVEYIVDETLGPLVDEIREDMLAESARGDERGFAKEFADRVFDLTVLDPAMGSGHFPVNAVDYLAREIINAQEQQDRQALDSEDAEVRSPTTEEGELRDINWARRKVAQRCIYGVDVNPLATELAKVSLWLRTLAAEQPLAFLDHHLKTGNSLVGSDIEEVLSDSDDDAPGDGQLTLQQSFDHTRKRAMEHVTDRFQDLLNIDNETLEDAKEMEAVYDDVRNDPLYKKLLAMANVHTSDAFGLDIPDDADERMARALHSESWENIEDQGWFKNAQSMAEDERFFHWELEFPMAFYDQDGSRKYDGGFDAVIGNPPWVSFGLRDVGKVPESFENYLRKKYPESAQYKLSIYAIFMDRAVSLCRCGGLQSFITPDSYLLGQYFEKIRKNLLYQTDIMSLTLILEDFWEGATTGRNTIYIVRKGASSEGNDMSVRVADTLEQFERGEEQGTSYEQKFFKSRPLHRFHLFFKKEQKSLVDSVESGADKVLNDHLSIHTGMRSRTSQSDIKSPQKKGPNWKKGIVSSGQVHPYDVSYEGHYLHCQGDKLFSGGWDPDVIEQGEKIFIRQTGDRITAGYDDDQLYHLNNTHSAVTRDGVDLPVMFYVCQLNSNLLFAYYTLTTLEYGRAMAQTDIETLEKLPLNIPDTNRDLSETEEKALIAKENCQGKQIPNSKVVAALETLGFQRKRLTDKREGFNLNLIDYLGNYKEGPTLPDTGIFQPTESNILDTSTDDYNKLQIERARTRRDDSTITIEATARYKPENQEEFETDTYGYTETEFFEAFTLTDISDEEATLVETFVPVAVDEEIANFTDKATKNISLVDRLKRMALPDPDDVADDLRRYIEAKERADELDEAIEKTDQLIDEIVYGLYDLTDEEIEIVEEAVADD
nr:TaqI-like C-terminal specificity domain-containing protein [Halococcus hamelinensis]